MQLGIIKFILILFFASSLLIGQEFYSKNHTRSDGLPSSSVHDCFRDSLGYMWFITENGISRYDGVNFQNIKNKKGKSSVFYNSFYEAHRRVWVSNASNELYFFDPLAENVVLNEFKYNSGIKEALKKNGITSFIRNFKASDSAYHISFTNAGIIEIRKGEVSVQGFGGDYKLFSPPSYCDLDIHQENNFFYSKYRVDTTHPGDIQLRIGINLKESNLDDLALKAGRSYGISAVKSSESRTVIILRDFLLIINKKDKRLHYKQLPAEGLGVEIFEDELLIGTIDGLIIANSNGEILDKFFSEETITSIQKIDNGIWATSSTDGVHFIPNINIRILRKVKKTQFADFIDSSKFLLMTDELSIFDFKDGKQIFHDSSAQYSRNVIFSQNARLLRFLTTKVYDYHFEQNDEKVYILPRFTDSTHLITRKSIIRSNENSDKLETLLNTNSRLNDFIPLSNEKKNFLVATKDGLYTFQEGSKSLKKFDEKKEVFNSEIKSISKVQDYFVANSNQYGIVVFDKHGKIWTPDIFKTDLLGKISSIQTIQNNTILVSSDRGFFKVRIDASGITKIYHLSTKNGLPSNEISSFAIRNHDIIGTTNQEIFSLKLEDFERSNILKPDHFFLDSISVGGIANRRIYFSDTVTGSSDEKVDFFMKQICFSNASPIKFQYRIVNNGGDWVNIEQRKLSLDNLPSGEYIINIRPAYETEYGKHKSIFLKIYTPWYRTYWMIIFYIAFFLTALFFAFRLALKRLEKKKQKEIEKISLELKVLISQMNPHFTFNTINSIQYFILSEDKDTALRYLSDFASLIRKTLVFSRQEFISLKEEIEFLALYVSLENKRFDKTIDFSQSLVLNTSSDQITIPALLLQPIIENAIIHGLHGTERNPSLLLSVQEKINYLKICITDNGRGFIAEKKQNKKQKSFGLDILKERLELYNNKEIEKPFIEVNSDKNGTQITIKIVKMPYRKNDE